MTLTTLRPPAISGTAGNSEVVIMTVYPSIAAIGLGRLMGKLFESIPLRICGVKLSHYLFVLPLAPLAALLYFAMKVSGHRYQLTNRHVQRWQSLGNQRLGQVSLDDITDVELHQTAGQAFYKAADLILRGKNGESLMVLAGIPTPSIFRQTIIEARDSRQQVQSSLATIRARG